MSIRLMSITLNTAKLTEQVEFYSALGFRLEKVKVAKGSEYFRAALPEASATSAGFEIRIYGLQDKKNSATPSLQYCFSVVGVEETFKKVQAISGVSVLMDPTVMPDGLMAIVKDPDGNSIELIGI